MVNVRDWVVPLKEEFGPSILNGSFINENNGLDDILYFMDTYFKGGNIVEIGTCAGVSAAILAQYSGRVYTYDLNPSYFPGKPPTLNKPYSEMQLNDLAVEVWKFLGVEDKIVQRFTKSKTIPDVSDLDFTLGYIDGDHSYAGVKNDFTALEKCGTLILHDHDKRHPTVKKFVGELQKIGDAFVEVRGKVAFWQREV